MGTPYFRNALPQAPSVPYASEKQGEPHLIIELRKYSFPRPMSNTTWYNKFPVTMWAPSKDAAEKELSRRQFANYVAIYNIESEELVNCHDAMTMIDKDEILRTFQHYVQRQKHMSSKILSECEKKLEWHVSKLKYCDQESEKMEEAFKKAEARLSYLEKLHKDTKEVHEEKVEQLTSRILHVEEAQKKDVACKPQLEKLYKGLQGCYQSMQRSIRSLETKCEDASTKIKGLHDELAQCQKSCQSLEERVRLAERTKADSRKEIEDERARGEEFKKSVSTLIDNGESKMRKSFGGVIRELREKIKFLENKVYKEYDTAHAVRITRAPNTEGRSVPPSTNAVSAQSSVTSSVSCFPSLLEREKKRQTGILRPSATDGPSFCTVFGLGSASDGQLLPCSTQVYGVGGPELGDQETRPPRIHAAVHEKPFSTLTASASAAALSSQKVITDQHTSPSTPRRRTPIRFASADRQVAPTKSAGKTTKTTVRSDLSEKPDTTSSSTTTAEREPVSDNSSGMREIITAAVPSIALTEKSRPTPASSVGLHQQRAEEIKLHSNASRRTPAAQPCRSHDLLIDTKAIDPQSKTPEPHCTKPEECPIKRNSHQESDSAPPATTHSKSHCAQPVTISSKSYFPQPFKTSPERLLSSLEKLPPSLSECKNDDNRLPPGEADCLSPHPSRVGRSSVDSKEDLSCRSVVFDKPTSPAAHISCPLLDREAANETYAFSKTAIRTPVSATSDKRATQTTLGKSTKRTSDKLSQENPERSATHVMQEISPVGIPVTSARRTWAPTSVSREELDRKQAEEVKALSDISCSAPTGQSPSSTHCDATAPSVAQPKSGTLQCQSAESNCCAPKDTAQIQFGPTLPTSNRTTRCFPRNATDYSPTSQSSIPSRGTAELYARNCAQNSKNPLTLPQATHSATPAQGAARRVTSSPTREHPTTTQADRCHVVKPLRRPKLPSKYADQAEAILTDWGNIKPEDRKKEYKQLLKKWHPDKASGNRGLATEMSQWLNSIETKKYLQL